MARSRSGKGQGVIALLGDLAVADDLPGVLALDSQQEAAAVMATVDASIAEVAAAQVPRLRDLDPASVVVQLGPRDLVDGFDESYFHAGVVEVCDGIQQAAPEAVVNVVAVSLGPWFSATQAGDDLRIRWCLFNAAAQVTANLRGFHFWRR